MKKAEGALKLAAILGGLLLALLINHRSYLIDFNLVPGDAGDTRLVIFTLEHWYSVFAGREAFFDLHAFHPDPLPLAYTDAMFLFGLPYSIARAIGADYFTSYQLVLALLTMIGYCAWMMVLDKCLRLQSGFAILGSVLLTSLNALQLLSDYGKFAAVNLLPVLILLLFGVLRPVQHSTPTWRSALGTTALASGFGLLLFTSYHVAWFFVFTLGVLGMVSLVAAALSGGLTVVWRSILALVVTRRWSLLAGILALGISLIPFLITYAPLVQSGSFRGFDLVLEFSPRARDVINVSSLNYVWSPLLQALGFDFGNRELQMGSPPLILLLAAATAISHVLRLHGKGWRTAEGTSRLLLSLSVTAVLLVLLSIKLDGFSAWYLVYRIVPGAAAVRALGRILVMVDMIAIVVALHGLQELYQSLGASRAAPVITAKVGFGLLAVLLIAEQVNGMTFRLSKSDQLAFIERYGAPRQLCQAFYLNNVPRENVPFGYYHLDAMMIGMHLGIPTVNGYSGFEPHEAFTLVPAGAEYEYRILEWLRQESATRDICELDSQTGMFRTVDVGAEFSAAQQEFRRELMDTFTLLVAAARGFVADGNDWQDLYPEFLQEHGYLLPGLGHEEGTRYKWIQGRYWIGERACGQRKCVGIGITGRYGDLESIFQTFAPLADRVYFPQQDQVWLKAAVTERDLGEALFLFSPEGPALSPQ